LSNHIWVARASTLRHSGEMSALHPLTFVFILITVSCLGFLAGLRFGIICCNRTLREIRAQLNQTADLLASRERP